MIPADICEIGFVPSGNSTLGLVACITNEKSSFAASLVFSSLILWSVFQFWGVEGKSFVYFCNVCLPSCCCLFVLVATGKTVALTLDHPATSDRGFLFPVSL